MPILHAVTFVTGALVSKKKFTSRVYIGLPHAFIADPHTPLYLINSITHIRVAKKKKTQGPCVCKLQGHRTGTVQCGAGVTKVRVVVRVVAKTRPVYTLYFFF
jgi:hypothetical protein